MFKESPGRTLHCQITSDLVAGMQARQVPELPWCVHSFCMTLKMDLVLCATLFTVLLYAKVETKPLTKPPVPIKSSSLDQRSGVHSLSLCVIS
jgi:hypothetical protein